MNSIPNIIIRFLLTNKRKKLENFFKKILIV